jgi:hypothetical protein
MDELNESTFETERNFALTVNAMPRNDALLGIQIFSPAIETKCMDELNESTFETERNFALTVKTMPRNDALLGIQLFSPTIDTKCMDELNGSTFNTECNFDLTVREITMPTILSMQPATWMQHRLTMRQIASDYDERHASEIDNTNARGIDTEQARENANKNANAIDTTLYNSPLERELVPDLAGRARANGSILESNTQCLNRIMATVAHELDSLPHSTHNLWTLLLRSLISCTRVQSKRSTPMQLRAQRTSSTSRTKSPPLERLENPVNRSLLPSSVVQRKSLIRQSIVIAIATAIANEQNKVAAIRTFGESCEEEPSSFVEVATEISNKQLGAIANEHATEPFTEMATNILCELELQLLAKLENEIDKHFQHGLDIATVQTLLKYDPTLQPRMIVGVEIEEHLQSAHQNYIKQPLLHSTLALPLKLKLVFEINMHLQREFRIATVKAILSSDFASQLRSKLECRPPYLNPRDREIRAALPIEGGSDLDLAGQASAASVGAQVANLVNGLTILLRTVIEVDMNLEDELNVNLEEESANLGNVIDIDIGNELEMNHVQLDKAIDVDLGHELAETIDSRRTMNLVPPHFPPRDRDICAAPTLEGESVSGLAGQASAVSEDLHHECLEPTDPYTQCDDQFGLIPFEILGLYTETMKTIASKQLQLAINSSPTKDTKPNNEDELRLNLGDERALPPTNNFPVDLGNGITLLNNDPGQLDFHEQLRHIINEENTTLSIMESQLNKASDVILMLHDPSQRKLLERLIDEDNMEQEEKRQRLNTNVQNSQDLEAQQMQDDIRYEENAMTESIIESFGGLFNERNDGSAESDSSGEYNTDFYAYSADSSEDDINENTDTEDGAEDLIELVGANTRLIAFLAKQRETLARLRHRISRMRRHIDRLTSRLNEITADSLRNQDVPTPIVLGDQATVLVDTEMDTSLLLQPHRDSKELDLFHNIEVKRELETKLKSLHGTTESELWMYFDSGASRSVISTESPIRKHLKDIVPAYGSCSVGNGTPLQYIETGKVKDNLEITVVADLKYDLFSSVNAAKQGLTSIIDYDLKTGKNNSFTIDKVTGSVTPLIERGKGILELPLHIMLPRGKCLTLASPIAPQQATLSPNIVSMFWHFYDDKSFDPVTRKNNQTEYSLFTFDIIKSLNPRERDFLIHARLGHLPRKKILHMIKNGTTGIGDYSGKFKELCKPCLQAKQRAENHGHEHKRHPNGRPGEHLHSDLAVLSTPDLNGNKYVLTVVDEISQEIIIALLRNKTAENVCRVSKKIQLLIAARTGNKLLTWQFDRGTEFLKAPLNNG